MQIEFVDFVAGAQKADGIVVVIDVFRAFTTACYYMNAGAQRAICVAESERALKYRLNLASPVLLGERYGKRLSGFDFGNSPSEIANENLVGKTIIHTTHAGTQGLVNARGAEQLYTGALVNAKATARYIREQNPAKVTLVRMGLNADEPSDEDWLCADYLAALLQGRPVDEPAIYRQLRTSPFAARFFDELQPWNPVEDFDCCLAFNKFDFALQALPLPDGACELKLRHL